ncbi:hypothetical protein SAMN05421771_2722 [Granulicella pectinivorans]|uniref:Uncharacterized protein n=1 Tax=Granulicella pectinivorans TaxID=474950 RepID=A0A1I6MII7_9BACT|nr:hypothetical protein [Granulicella pectinivorans]SFS15504.1 hypothetical protein SAMN05421771_2722 [Granulicella pectinivorans]
MSESKMLFPEGVGKSVAEVSVLDDPEFGKEVLLRFSDGTQLSIAVGVRQTIDARYCQEELPDTPISHKQAN